VIEHEGWSRPAPEALTAYAPDVGWAALAGSRPAGLPYELEVDPRVVAFAEQFVADVSVIGDGQRAAYLEAAGDAAFAMIQMIYVADLWPRLRSALDALFVPGGWPPDDPHPVDDLWGALEAFMADVARLDALDPTLTELVRLRGARQHDCRLCTSRRSIAAIEAGADDATFAAVDRWRDSDLPAPTKAALGLVDAMIWTPSAISAEVVAAVHEQLTPAQAVEVVLDVVRNAANKIAVALGADAPEVDGIQLFTTAADGTVIPADPSPIEDGSP